MISKDNLIHNLGITVYIIYIFNFSKNGYDNSGKGCQVISFQEMKWLWYEVCYYEILKFLGFLPRISKIKDKHTNF